MLIVIVYIDAPDLSAAFSELASKVSECPSATRGITIIIVTIIIIFILLKLGGALGTFKPGMMVKEFDQICFEKEVGVVHGPIQTQFGSHLILITRRYEGDDKK
jgi:peptidyl-prolyl cis-trans isomerase C